MSNEILALIWERNAGKFKGAWDVKIDASGLFGIHTYLTAAELCRKPGASREFRTRIVLFLARQCTKNSSNEMNTLDHLVQALMEIHRSVEN